VLRASSSNAPLSIWVTSRPRLRARAAQPRAATRTGRGDLVGCARLEVGVHHHGDDHAPAARSSTVAQARARAPHRAAAVAAVSTPVALTSASTAARVVEAGQGDDLVALQQRVQVGCVGRLWGDRDPAGECRRLDLREVGAGTG